jgi:hypothetical protein
MTAKTWCAISKAVEMIRAVQNTSVGAAKGWLIAACVTGNIRSRMATSPDSELLLNDNGLASMDFRPGSRSPIISRRRAPEPLSPAAWKDAVIDGDILVDADHGRWPGVEISIADLEFDLKQSLPPTGTALAAPIPRTGGRASDKEAIIAEAQRRVAADESSPPTLSAFARELHFWLDQQPRVLRRAKTGRVLGPASIEEHIRPLWRKYRGE